VTLDLGGLTAGPSQVWGGVRLVPLVRAEPVGGLRLHRRALSALGADLGGGRTYWSYVPHAFVADWSGEGEGAAYGTSLTEGDAAPVSARIGLHRRMVRKEEARAARFLPLHLAMEGFLSLHFGGPAIAWEEWSRDTLRKGLSPRTESTWSGHAVRGLEEALKLFEIHPGQCGVMLYVADALAAGFVVPHPDDYRALHGTLLLDFYGELIHHYGLLSAPVPQFLARLEDVEERISSLADLREAARAQERAWREFHDGVMARELLGVVNRVRQVRRLGPFTMSRFLPVFRPREENHIGELITAEDGTVAYLKTFRLGDKQVRRGHLLDCLDAAGWHLDTAARALGVTRDGLIARLHSAGFGSLLRRDVLDQHRSRMRAAGGPA
jgi:hypothetical protein